jgi:ribosome-binding factor A
MVAEARARKLADRVREIVAETLEMRIKDPRLGFITITDARVTPDLREATVFYTVYGDEEARASTAAALESAKGVLRSEVGRQTGIKHTPSLAFVLDAVPDTARHIDELLRAAAESDAEVHAQATGARYAGDPDPYRHSDEPDEDDAKE